MQHFTRDRLYRCVCTEFEGMGKKNGEERVDASALSPEMMLCFGGHYSRTKFSATVWVCRDLRQVLMPSRKKMYQCT